MQSYPLKVLRSREVKFRILVMLIPLFYREKQKEYVHKQNQEQHGNIENI